jgi:hypothetical protein
MLRIAKVQREGLRLHDALSRAPLAVVYQCIGNVKACQLEDTLSAQLPAPPDEGLTARPVSFRLKNSLADATGLKDVAGFLKATNILVAWQLAGSAPTPQGSYVPDPPLTATQTAGIHYKKDDALERIVEAQARAASAGPGPGSAGGAVPQPPQRTLSALIKSSLSLSTKYPLAPLVGFCHGRRVRVSELERWSELDDKQVGSSCSRMAPHAGQAQPPLHRSCVLLHVWRLKPRPLCGPQVYSELLGQLVSVPSGLLAALNVGDAGLSGLLDARSGGELVGLLEARAAAAKADGVTA